MTLKPSPGTGIIDSRKSVVASRTRGILGVILMRGIFFGLDATILEALSGCFAWTDKLPFATAHADSSVV